MGSMPLCDTLHWSSKGCTCHHISVKLNYSTVLYWEIPHQKLIKIEHSKFKKYTVAQFGIEITINFVLTLHKLFVNIAHHNYWYHRYMSLYYIWEVVKYDKGYYDLWIHYNYYGHWHWLGHSLNLANLPVYFMLWSEYESIN